jgi:NADPH:quinone reductase-like Zn-dependent oxidoreductase
MRAYQLPKGGAGIDALVVVEQPEPKPSYRQVVVKVAACSLNFRELGIVRGTYRIPIGQRDNVVRDPALAGLVAVGAGVKRVKVGDKVAGCFFQRWPGGEPGPDVHAPIARANCRPKIETSPVPCRRTVWPAISSPCSTKARTSAKSSSA